MELLCFSNKFLHRELYYETVFCAGGRLPFCLRALWHYFCQFFKYRFMVRIEEGDFLYCRIVPLQCCVRFRLQQRESAVCIHIFPLFLFLSQLGHHRALSGVSCADSRVSLVIHFIHCNVYMSIPVSQFIPPLFPPWYPNICFLYLCLYFCFASKFIYTIFLDST